jgi:hypothetical protein
MIDPFGAVQKQGAGSSRITANPARSPDRAHARAQSKRPTNTAHRPHRPAATAQNPKETEEDRSKIAKIAATIPQPPKTVIR